jgi:RNA-directed DNA polymerase
VKSDAERLLAELTDGCRKFKLELHPVKTRLLKFGRFAAENRKKLLAREAETFSFPGFPHFCGKTRKGRFTVWVLRPKSSHPSIQALCRH